MSGETPAEKDNNGGNSYGDLSNELRRQLKKKKKWANLKGSVQ